jgi:hypothetical protein
MVWNAQSWCMEHRPSANKMGPAAYYQGLFANTSERSDMSLRSDVSLGQQPVHFEESTWNN